MTHPNLEEVVKFLLGAGRMFGFTFSEAQERFPYSWRDHLEKAWNEHQRQLTELQKANEWISVDTAVPESGEHVLVCLNDGQQMMGRHYSVWYLYWMEGYKTFHPSDETRHVTHWRKLPAPPSK